MTILEQTLALYERLQKEKNPSHTATRSMEGYITQHFGREGMLAVAKLKSVRPATVNKGEPREMREFKPTVGKQAASLTPVSAKPRKEFKPVSSPSEPKELSSPEVKKDVVVSNPVVANTNPVNKAFLLEKPSTSDIMGKYSPEQIKAFFDAEGITYSAEKSHRQLAGQLVRLND